VDIATGKIVDSVRFDSGVVIMVTGGRNMGRVGVITHRERHDGGFNIVHVKDAIDNTFATRESNVFIIGQEKPWVSLPKGKGVKVRSHPHSTFMPTRTNMFDSSPLLRSVTAAVPTLLPTKCFRTLAISMLADGSKKLTKTVAGKRRLVLLYGLG